MRLFAIPPDKASYAVDDANAVIATTVASGATRYRKDMFGARPRINVQWTCDRDKYQYVRSFFRAIVDEGSLPFELDLIIDNPGLTRHECHFIPGSLKLTAHSGFTYIVSAQIEATPRLVNEFDFEFVYIYDNFGSYFPLYDDMLNTIVNIDLPRIFNNG